jgi:hypothetical protein
MEFLVIHSVEERQYVQETKNNKHKV